MGKGQLATYVVSPFFPLCSSGHKLQTATDCLFDQVQVAEDRAFVNAELVGQRRDRRADAAVLHFQELRAATKPVQVRFSAALLRLRSPALTPPSPDLSATGARRGSPKPSSGRAVRGRTGR
jgi:hypothetical protein